MNQHYDYIIVGSGLWGATFAFEASKHGKKVLVLEKREHIGGNVYTKQVNGINVHMYGAHIFNTDREDIWKYINQFAQFNNYINHVYAVNNNKLQQKLIKNKNIRIIPIESKWSVASA